MYSDKIANMYLEFFNDWLTIEKFAEHYNYTIPQAEILLKIGQELHEARVLQINELKAQRAEFLKEIEDKKIALVPDSVVYKVWG